MPFKEAKRYYEAITCIEAQDNLVKMGIADYPRMSKDGRRDYYRKMRKLAYPKELQTEMSFEDFAKKIGITNGRKG